MAYFIRPTVTAAQVRSERRRQALTVCAIVGSLLITGLVIAVWSGLRIRWDVPEGASHFRVRVGFDLIEAEGPAPANE